MSSIIKVGERWRAQVRRKDWPAQTRTFPTKILAERWARNVEASIDVGRATNTGRLGGSVSVAKLVDRYTLEVGKVKPFGRNKADVLARIKDLLGADDATKLAPERIVRYIQEDRGIGGVTASIDLAYLKGVLRIARALWKHDVHPSVVDEARDILGHMGVSSRSNERDRRATPDELTKLRAWLADHSTSLTPDLFDFILDSGFRPPSEIQGLRWADLNRKDRTILIRDRKDPRKKIGNHQTVPLLGRCMDIIARQPEQGEFIFRFRGHTWSSIFPRACLALKITDLRLYDLRHESLSRLVESGKYSIPEIMLVSGHKDPKQLMRYTQLRAKDLHDR